MSARAKSENAVGGFTESDVSHVRAVEEATSGLVFLTLGGFAAILYKIAVSSDVWVPFFLSCKPIIDLTWRWRFLDVFQQGVNLQSVLAIFVAAFNSFVFIAEKPKVPHYRLVLLFLGFASLSVMLSPTDWGANELIRLYAGVSFFFTAGLTLTNKKRFDKFVDYFLVALTIPLFLALLQALGLLPFDYWDWSEAGEYGRASGSYQHPLDLVFFLIYAIPFAFYRLGDAGISENKRICLYAFLSFAGLGLIFTFHRMGWFAIAVQIGFWLFFKRQHKSILLGTIGLLALFVAFGGMFQTLFEPVTQVLEGQLEVSSNSFLRGRGANYFLFLSSYANGGPLGWLVGRGGSVADGSLLLEGLAEKSPNEPHNDFIRILHAYGLAGLFLYLWILAAFYRASRALQRCDDSFARDIGNLLFVALAAVLLLSLTAEPMRYPSGTWYLFSLGSIAVTLCHKAVPRKSSQQVP